MQLGRNITYECMNVCYVSQSVSDPSRFKNVSDDVFKEKFNGEIIFH